jgi:hypothetical protein
VPRLSVEDLKFCKQERICFDCYQAGDHRPGVELQRRGGFEVPCCRKHFYAYKNKINEAEAKKAARNFAEKRRTRRCIYKGCHHKLIPQELLPPWIRERTCGTHSRYKAFRVNRNTILPLLIEHYLTPEEREMTVQHVIYKRRRGLVWFSVSEPGLYLTKCCWADDLLNLRKKLR